ncbi:hypothetical protein MPL3365_290056 [Mesorhizobium plurifarium]|uniref:Uncharacterized protein n=1 Tax=Mesorhizobium plurifarium TaxID=69974 RepID=A0A090GDH9_MESPL|nr:hypothetical protein MPL3365_290056 [Mesorhizobium plurifarium]
MGGENDRKGPPSEVAGIRRTGTQVEDPERERRVAGRRGGPRRESCPHRAAGKAKSKRQRRPKGRRPAQPARAARARGRSRMAETA